MLPSIDLAFVGLGLHEQLVAYTADQLDHFSAEGVHVAVRDGRRWPIERLRQGAVVGLGRTQVSRLRDGVPWTIACVNTDRPMFWLVAAPGHGTVSDLRHCRIGLHSPASAPGLWTRIVLRRHGLDPDRDITAVVIPAGDYRPHLRMLRDGELDAAVIGSTVDPHQTAAEEGLEVLAFFGDEIRIPTTGVALDPTIVDPDSEAVRGLVAGHRRALRTLVDEPEVAIELVVGLIPSLSAGDAAKLYERYIRPHFFPDGLADRAIVEQGLSALARELGGVELPDVDVLYRGSVRSA
jgi:ABC-type nitrate/sulfonate/bicarbonate transport system substrate-binding protein